MRLAVLALLALVAGCAREFNYVAYPAYDGPPLPREHVASLSTQSGVPGRYIVWLNAVDGRSAPDSRNDFAIVYHVAPGPHRLRLIYSGAAGAHGTYRRSAKPVELDVVALAGSGYVFEAQEAEDGKTVRIRARDVGRGVPDACLNMNHPAPPPLCAAYPWWRR